MTKKAPSKNKPNFLFRYSSMGIKMAAIIVGGVFLGQYLDEYKLTKFPLFTLILTLASVTLAIYVMIRDVSSK
jgi:F0F1-type ATP synthase assembly protein I